MSTVGTIRVRPLYALLTFPLTDEICKSAYTFNYEDEPTTVVSRRGEPHEREEGARRRCYRCVIKHICCRHTLTDLFSSNRADTLCEDAQRTEHT